MPESPATGPTSVQFDFDGVLVRRDSTATFIVRRLRARPARLVLAVAPAAAYLATRPLPRLQSRLARLLLRITMHGETPAAVRASLADLAREMAADGRVTVQPAVAAVREAMARGDRVLVNSASFEDFLVPFLAAHELAPDVVGSTLRATRRGTVMDRHNHGTQKVESARALGWTDPDVVVSDSSSDLPLLATARTAVLVDPSASLLRRVRRDLPRTEVEVVRWR